MRRRDSRAMDRRTMLAGMALGGLVALGSGRQAPGAVTGWGGPSLAVPVGLEDLAVTMADGLAAPPVTVVGAGWLAAAQAVADGAAALGLVLRAADDAAPWPGGAALEAASQTFTPQLALWSTVPLADVAAFGGLAVGVAGVGGLGLRGLGMCPVPLDARALAPALREGRIAVAAPSPAEGGTVLGLHRIAPYLVAAAAPQPPLRLCWLIAPGFADGLPPAVRQALVTALRRSLAVAVGAPAGALVVGPSLPGPAEAAARGIRRAALPAAAGRAHGAALRALAARAPGLA